MPRKYDPERLRPYWNGTHASFRKGCAALGWDWRNAERAYLRLKQEMAMAAAPVGDQQDAPVTGGKPETAVERLARLERERREAEATVIREQVLTNEEAALRVIPDAPRARGYQGAKQRETAVLAMSDLHWGKKTLTFDNRILRARLEAFGVKLAAIRDLMSEYEFDELVILLLGDVNDGTEIYPSQAHHQDTSNVEDQASDLSAFLAPWLRAQADVWGRVRVEAVPGNHGRAGKGAHEAANWDIVAYKYTSFRLGDSIPVHLNRQGSPFIRKTRVYEHDLLLHHGHEIKMHMSIPWYGLQLRLGRWATSNLAPFDLFVCGHFHSVGYWQINRIPVFLNGTAVTDDNWALEGLGYDSGTKWWLWGMSPSRLVTWQFGLSIAGDGPAAIPKGIGDA
jgi:predicted phosphodiesterase